MPGTRFNQVPAAPSVLQFSRNSAFVTNYSTVSLLPQFNKRLELKTSEQHHSTKRKHDAAAVSAAPAAAPPQHQKQQQQ